MSSKTEALFSLIVRGLPAAETEHAFHPTRRWRFDFAWPDKMVAVECEGGVYSRGRHTRGSGFTADCEKYSAAAMLGWRVLRFTTEQLMKNPKGCRTMVEKTLGVCDVKDG